MIRIVPLFLCSVFLACENKNEDSSSLICSSDIAFSVYVTIYDDNGQVRTNASPTYSVDGGSEGSCEQDGIGGYYCGEEQTGNVTIHVNVEGYEPVEESVVVEADECHVKMETMNINLTPSG